MSPIQIIILIIIALIIIKTWQKYRQQSITIREFFLWVGFWLMVSLVIVFNEATNFIAHLLGIGRGVDLIFVVSTIVIVYVIFKILLRLEKIEKNITKIVRQIALGNE